MVLDCSVPTACAASMAGSDESANARVGRNSSRRPARSSLAPACSCAISQDAFASAAAHRAQHVSLQLAGAVEAAPFDRQRQGVVRRSVRRRHFGDAERKSGIALRDGKHGPELGVESLPLVGEPSACRQERRQHLALEDLMGAAFDQRAPAVAEHQGHQLRNDRGRLDGAGIFRQQEPEESVRGERDQVRRLGNPREPRAAEHFHRHEAAPRRQVDFRRLGGARQIGDAQHDLVLILAQIDQYGAIGRAQERQVAAAEHRARPAHRDQSLHPAQQRRQAVRLRLDVDGLIAVHRIHDHRQEQLRGIAAREPAVAVRSPLHRRAHAVAVAQIDVVAHADLVAVVDDRRAGEGKEQAVHQMDAAAMVLHQRREPAADAEVDARLRVGSVGPPHVVAVLIRDHLQGQLVVIAQEEGPLTVLRDGRRLGHDVDDREAILLRHGHIHARHDREVEGHVALIAISEVRA